MLEKTNNEQTLTFYGGLLGAIFPFFLFVGGVISIALSGAPDEKGFWPGMSQEIVMIMITAWILASIIGVLMTATGFVEALTWMAAQLHLSGEGMVVSTFLICCLVSLSTGSSFATILICSPLLYPAGGLLGAHLPTLAGAILGGATFGDFIAPISDTTIASSLSQKAEIGPTVRSRIKYIIPVFIVSVIGYFISATLSSQQAIQPTSELTGSPKGLPMLIVPILIIYLFLKGKHLLHGLLYGLMVGVVIGLVFGLLPYDRLFSLDLDNFVAKSFVIDGINRAVGLSFFTILLMGLVAALKASGLMERLVAFAEKNSSKQSHAEGWMAGTVGAAVLLTTHSIVAILMVAEFANSTGKKMGVLPQRRANILSLVVCVFPFLLPYFIPVILMANTTNAGAELGIPTVSPLETGLHNFVAWGLLGMAILVVGFGFGRNRA